jgi:hypothetical protein
MKVCEKEDANAISCLENIVKTLDSDTKARESLGEEFKLLYMAVKCKQGEFKQLQSILSTKLSTRYFKGLFSYLWPDTILSKF